MANPYFNAAYYLAQNPDVSAAGYTAATAESHYNAYGAVEGRAPAAWFNGAFYLAQNPDLQAAGYTLANVFAHFAQYGVHEGRSPSPNVALTTASLSAYAAANADLAKAFGITDPAYLTAQQKDALASHFYQYGYYESRPGNPVTEPVGGTFTLTIGADTKVGTAGNDTFDGGLVGTLSAFDNLDGGAGADTVNALISTTTLPSGLTIKNIETANINTTGAGLTADVSGWTGLTAANVTVGAAGGAAVTAAATTDVTAKFISGSSSVIGGKKVVVESSALANADTITVGAGTAAIGDITITAVSATGTSTGTLAATTKGGANVSITETGETTGQRAMNVTDSAAAAAVEGTLAKVTLDGYGASSTVKSNALTSLTLANSTTAATNVTVTNDSAADIAAKSSVLGLTVNNLTGATTLVDTNNVYGTLNITTAGGTTAAGVAKDSTLTAITASNVTALTVDGTNKLTLTNATGLTGLKTVEVKGAAGLTVAANVSAVATNLASVNTSATTGTVTLGATTVTEGIGNAVSYTGGAGKDILTVGATTKAIDLGAGDNTLYLKAGTTAVGTGGSIAAGAGIADTLGMTAADAVTASASATFATKVTGFEKLTLGAATGAQEVDVAALLGTSNASHVTTTGVAANVLSLKNLNTSGAGATVVINNVTAVANAGVTLTGTAGAGASDTLNLKLNNTVTTATALVAFGTVTAQNVENIKLDVNDAHTATVGASALFANTVTIADTALQSLTVSGNQSLVLTHAGTALTSLDASGMTLGGLNFTSGALQYAATVKGSLLGGDTLNFGNAVAAVTITETAGTNSINGSLTVGSTLTGGTGNDTIVGGAGKDTIKVGAGATGNTVTAGAGADSIDLTGSTGADILNFGAKATTAGAAGANMDVITGFQSGSGDLIKITVSAATAANSSTGVVGDNVSTVTLGTAIADAVSVATVADVYTQLAANLTAGVFGVSASGAGNIKANVVTFATGEQAGTYLVINDGVAGFQAANDTVIKLVGTASLVGADIGYSYVA